MLLDATPVECGRSRETAKRSALADAAAYGYCRSHSLLLGHAPAPGRAPDGTPRAAALAEADRPEREVGLALLERTLRGGEAVVCDKGYAGAGFALGVEGLDARVLGPPRRDEYDPGVRLSFIRQRIESVFGTWKDVLTLERHGARTLANLRVRVATRLLTLAACIALNHELGRPSRSLVAHVA